LKVINHAKQGFAYTVGMMTTGYDCPDLLNICMMRPIFSPADFVQIKGRGTRKNTFEYKFKNELNEEEIIRHDKKFSSCLTSSPTANILKKSLITMKN
jgi:type I restriction enzyme, R subunit